MRPPLFIGLLVGVALLVAVAWTFSGALLAAALAGSAVPALCASAYRAVPLLLNTRSWQLLLPPGGRSRFGRLLWLRWIGDAINDVLPVAQLGGDVARAHLLARSGVPAAEAGAAMIGDFTVGVMTQVVFIVLALAALMARGGPGDLARPIAIGLALALALAAALWTVARKGAHRVIDRLRRWSTMIGPSRPWGHVAADALRVEAATQALFDRRRALAKAFGWHLAGWLAEVGETLLVLRLAGATVSLPAAMAVEGLSGAARALAFFIPGGLGVQEGAVVLLCRQVGVPAEAALTLTVVKRLRELIVGLPGVAAWLIAERRTPAALRASWRRYHQRQPVDSGR